MKKYCLIVGNGGSGNVMFQVAAIKSYLNDAVVILITNQPISRIIDGIGCHVLTLRGLAGKKIIYNTIKKITSLLMSTSMFSILGDGDDRIVTPQGLFQSIYICKHDFFQNTAHFDYSSANQWGLIKSVRNEVLLRLSDLGVARKYIAVQVRRGDYAIWPSKEHSALLDDDYYIQNVLRLRDKYGELDVLVCSDDPVYCRGLFNSIERCFVVEMSVIHEFYVLSLSSSIVISPSTFGYWAAWFVHKCNSGDVVAPKYWGGHRIGRWHPKFLKADWISYVDV